MPSIPRYCFIPVICFLFSLAYQPRLAAQFSPSGDLFSNQWQGFFTGFNPTACAIRNRTAFITYGKGITVVDITNIDAPRIHSDLSVRIGQPHWLRIANDTLLLAASVQGIAVLNIKDPLSPKILYDTTIRGIGGADLEGNRLFIAINYTAQGSQRVDSGAMVTFDIEDWSAVRSVASVSYPRYASTIRIDDDFIFFRTGSSSLIYKIFRLDNSGTPVYLRDFTPPGNVIDIAFRDSTIVCLYYNAQGTDIETFHFSSDGALTPLLSYDLDFILPITDGSAFAMIDSTIIIQSRTPGFPFPTSLRQHILAATIHGGRSLSFDDTLLCGLSMAGNQSRGVITGSDSIIICFVPEGLRLLTIDDQKRMKSRGLLKTHDFCRDVDGHADTIYTLTPDRLYILDFSEIASPDTLSAYPISAERVKALGADRIIVYDSVLTLLDVSDKRAPKPLSRLGLGRNIFGRTLAVRDSIAALVSPDAGTFILKIGDNSLALLGSIPMRGMDCLWRNDTLLITGPDTLLSIWTVSPNGSAEFIASPLDGIPPGYALAMTGDTLLIAGDSVHALFNASSLTDIHRTGDAPRCVHAEWMRKVLFCTVTGSPAGGIVAAYEFARGLPPAEIDSSTVTGDADFYLREDAMFLAGGSYGLKAIRVDTSLLSAPADYRPVSPLEIYVRPNPVSSAGVFIYRLSAHGRIRLSIVDLLGREVMTLIDTVQEAGEHVIPFDGAGLGGGVYYYRLVHGERRIPGKIVIVK